MTRAAVVALITLGALLVARAADVFRGTDALALGVVAMILLGLLVGAVELWLRATQAGCLLQEVAGLPRPATEASVEATSPPVRAWLSARLAGEPPPPESVGFTPYLVGLLVMLGMLGTFLGLVESLASARGVMAGSADVDALRHGLAAPVIGLTRAFGTSVAGVSASATLGLAAVFVRRAERAAAAALRGYAARRFAR